MTATNPIRMPRFARRTILGGLLATSSLAMVPWLAAQPASNAPLAPFMTLSALLVGRGDLDPAQGKRLFDALSAEDAAFPTAAGDLLRLIEDRAIDPARLQGTLDEEASPFAALPRKIVTAWCLGVVGTGTAARCLAFETALNAAIVADVLKPPTYAFGPYGSWAAPPPATPVPPAPGAPRAASVKLTPND